MATADLSLTGDQRKRLWGALNAAFPTRGDLEMFVSFELNENLDTITDGNLGDVTFQLIKWASARGCLQVLAERAGASSGNPQLRDFLASLESDDAENLADLTDLRERVRATLDTHPRVAAALVARLAVARGALVATLLDVVTAKQVAEHFDAVHQRLPTSGGDRAACEALFLSLLPAAVDWKDLRERLAPAVAASSKPVALPYRDETVAEIVMAGLHNRACRFVHEDGKMPVGVGLVPRPAGSQTATFAHGGRVLVEHVMEHLAHKLMLDRLPERDQRDRYVRAELTRLQEASGPERLRYYFLFHDHEHPDDEGADAFWTLTHESLGASLGQLQVARMSRSSQEGEAALSLLVRAILRRK